MTNPADSTARKRWISTNSGGYIFPADLIDTVWEALWFAVRKKERNCDDASERKMLFKLLRMMEVDIEQ